MYTDILFDADDTLLDFQKAQLYGFNEVLLHYGVVFTQEVYDSYARINHALWNKFEAGNMTKDHVQSKRFSEFFKELDKSVDGIEANTIYQCSLEKQSWLMPYAEDVCKKLSENYAITIVTNGVGKTQKKRISSSAIYPYIKHLVISEDIGVAKPDKLFFDYVTGLIGCLPKNMVLVGDSLSSDIRGANNASIDAYWYNPKLQPISKDLVVKGVIIDLRQLLDVL